MAKPPIIGYIVLRRHEINKGALQLCPAYTGPRTPILLWGDSATLFKSRGRAQTAICRTMRFFNRPVAEGGLHEAIPHTDFQIQPVRAQEER